MRNAATLTVCSVFFGSKYVYELNLQLAAFLNPSTKFSWITVNNSPEDEFINAPDERFTITRGPAKDTSILERVVAGYHHAEAINQVLPNVNSRFLLVLDPDFFILRKNWIDDVLAYMISENLAFFGASYHPRFYAKYRYFPCIQCMFIDCSKIPVDSLDFLPLHDLSELCKNQKPKNSFGNACQTILSKLPATTSDSLKTSENVKKLLVRGSVGASKDTGIKIYQKYARSSKCATVQHVYRKPDQVMGSATDSTRFQKFLEDILPDSLSFFPKRPNYSISRGFCNLDSLNPHWEESVWNGKPFGLHLRNYVSHSNNDGSKSEIIQLLQQVCGFRESRTEVGTLRQ